MIRTNGVVSLTPSVLSTRTKGAQPTASGSPLAVSLLLLLPLVALSLHLNRSSTVAP